MKLLEIEWIDATFRFDWEHGDSLEPHTMTTVGWLVGESNEWIAIANEKSSDSNFRGVTTIPKSLIQSQKLRR